MSSGEVVNLKSSMVDGMDHIMDEDTAEDGTFTWLCYITLIWTFSKLLRALRNSWLWWLAVQVFIWSARSCLVFEFKGTTFFLTGVWRWRSDFSLSFLRYDPSQMQTKYCLQCSFLLHVPQQIGKLLNPFWILLNSSSTDDDSDDEANAQEATDVAGSLVQPIARKSHLLMASPKAQMVNKIKFKSTAAYENEKWRRDDSDEINQARTRWTNWKLRLIRFNQHLYFFCTVTDIYLRLCIRYDLAIASHFRYYVMADLQTSLDAKKSLKYGKTQNLAIWVMLWRRQWRVPI